MDDLRRLLDDPTASPLARTLLASARGDEPGSGDRGSVARRLGAAGIVVAATGKSVAAAVAVWIVVIVAATGVGAWIVRAATHAPPDVVVNDPPARPSSRVMPSVPAVVAPPIEPPVAAPAPPPPRLTPPRVAVTAPTPKAAEPEPPARVDLPPPPSVVATESEAPPAQPPTRDGLDAERLAAEIALLDRARTALHRGDFAVALAALDEHAASFADGALVQEASVIRIDLLVARGSTDAARVLAHSFLARYPHSPVAPRLRAMFP